MQHGFFITLRHVIVVFLAFINVGLMIELEVAFPPPSPFDVLQNVAFTTKKALCVRVS